MQDNRGQKVDPAGEFSLFSVFGNEPCGSDEKRYRGDCKAENEVPVRPKGLSEIQRFILCVEIPIFSTPLLRTAWRTSTVCCSDPVASPRTATRKLG